MLRFACTLRDPVHGDISLTREELAVLDTREMQRLRHVRQLGVAYMVYPGAQHSRFEHSVGTLHMASRLVEAMNKVARQRPEAGLAMVDAHALRVIRMAALVHDVSHLPFGHNIEDQTGLLPRHDAPERLKSRLSLQTELGQALEKTGLRSEVLGVLVPSAAEAAAEVPLFWRALISGTIDADMLDYLARDAMFTGIRLQYDPRIFSVFRLDATSQQLYVELGRKGYLKEDVLSEVLRCLEARYYFSERVYYHHAKIAAGSMVAKAVEILLLEGALDLATLENLTDSELLTMLTQAKVSPAASKELAMFSQALQRRVLPKRVGVYPAYANGEHQPALLARFFGPGSAAERRRTEAAMSAALSQRCGRAIPMLLYCPAGPMQLKQAKMLVHWPGEVGFSLLSHYSDRVPRLLDLERCYVQSWKFYIHALTREPAELAQAQAVCAEFFPELENVLHVLSAV